MIEVSESELSILQQCELLNLNRSSYYWNLSRKEQEAVGEYNLLFLSIQSIVKEYVD